MTRFFLTLGILALVPNAWCKPLDSLLTDKALWTLKPEEFYAGAAKLGYEWTSSAQDSARVARDELKRMPIADAWTITTGTMSVEPF